jgi:hypothetical protein
MFLHLHCGQTGLGWMMAEVDMVGGRVKGINVGGWRWRSVFSEQDVKKCIKRGHEFCVDGSRISQEA